MAVPRTAVIRTIMFDHWYHHRGRLTVYPRLLNVPAPSVYGPRADESPYGWTAARLRLRHRRR